MRCHLPDAEATAAIGAQLARALAERRGGLVALHGDLGAGKTTLVRGVLRALGVTGPIRSPTYTLVEPYEVQGRRILHWDLYRLSAPRELHALGLEDDPPDASLWLVEWPERGQGVLPAANLSLHLRSQAAGRELEFTRGEALEEVIWQQIVTLCDKRP